MNKSGFTLLEVIVATVIFSIIMLSAMNLFVVGRRYMMHSRARMTGGEISKRFLVPLQLNVSQAEWGRNCLSGNLSNCTSGAYEHTQYKATYNITNVSGTDLRRVEVVVNWTDIEP